MYERFERDRDLIPQGRLAELRFEELTADPVGQMQKVYDQLDLGEFERARPAIAKYAAEHRDHRVSSYSLPPADRRARPPPIGALLRTLRLHREWRGRREQFSARHDPGVSCPSLRPLRWGGL